MEKLRDFSKILVENGETRFGFTCPKPQRVGLVTQESPSRISTFHGIPIKAQSKFSNPLITVDFLFLFFLSKITGLFY